ncbi:hypothetical protein BJP34_28170 [Moorena producens PAL-8-15-08-1]|uniref:Uncharacterized protein n=1 Tax=Moorena producens PAL-8-15-08-1 TaxID=1458985 RepID=A0A1D8TYS4_9CYAN|nr:hypothetical protein [Moorena producens]AOX02801.1 hypothetical protein BJP34_28170 [Moorena producens PAL-8-15-08-1]
MSDCRGFPHERLHQDGKRQKLPTPNPSQEGKEIRSFIVQEKRPYRFTSQTQTLYIYLSVILAFLRIIRAIQFSSPYFILLLPRSAISEQLMGYAHATRTAISYQLMGYIIASKPVPRARIVE